MRPRDARDFYPTPVGLIRAAMDRIYTNICQDQSDASVIQEILDPGAGLGVWGYGARERFPNARVSGVEYYFKERPSFYTGEWFVGDYTKNILPHGVYDLVIGNPPYKYAEQFVRQAMQHSKRYVVYLLRLGFLESQSRMDGLWKEMPTRQIFVLGKRPSFTGDGKTDATAYAIYFWDKVNPTRYPHEWLHWDYDKGIDHWGSQVEYDSIQTNPGVVPGKEKYASVANLDSLRRFVWGSVDERLR
ncbi:MAG TPA: hypothetical protein PKD55_00365 [Bellilinea sp.]|nr:hypothetical protein [Bellilinea sp.]